MKRETLEVIHDALGKPMVILAMLIVQTLVGICTALWVSVWLAVAAIPFVALDAYRISAVLRRSSSRSRSAPRHR